MTAAFLRLFDLNGNPPGVFSDELVPWEGTFNYIIGSGPSYVFPKPIASIIQGVIYGQFFVPLFAWPEHFGN